MDTAAKASVLFVYYSYTKQTLKVVETKAGVLRDRGSEVVEVRSNCSFLVQWFAVGG